MSTPYPPPQGPYDPYGSPPGFGPPQDQQPQQPPYYGYPQQQPASYPQQPTFGQPGYPAQQPMPYGYPAAPQPDNVQPNNLATASIVLGFLSVFGMCFAPALLLGPVSLGLGIGGLTRANRTGVGRSNAIGGIVVGSIGVLIMIGYVLLYAVVASKRQ